MLLMNETNYKWIGVDNTRIIRTDHDITAMTGDHTNTSFVAVCCRMEDLLIIQGAVMELWRRKIRKLINRLKKAISQWILLSSLVVSILIK